MTLLFSALVVGSSPFFCSNHVFWSGRFVIEAVFIWGLRVCLSIVWSLSSDLTNGWSLWNITLIVYLGIEASSCHWGHSICFLDGMTLLLLALFVESSYSWLESPWFFEWMT